MMHCRMCSQRLTRLGKLCRECECELERGRHVGFAVAELAAPGALLDAPSRAMPAWLARIRPPGALVAAAFAVGLAGTVALHVVDASQTAARPHSVMIDTSLPATSRTPPGPMPATSDDPPRVTETARVSNDHASRAAEPHARAASVDVPRTAPATAASAAVPQPAQIALRTAAEQSNVRGDPADALDGALRRCASESFFARPACEERARARHCDGAAALPQCAAPMRDHGQ